MGNLLAYKSLQCPSPTMWSMPNNGKQLHMPQSTATYHIRLNETTMALCHRKPLTDTVRKQGIKCATANLTIKSTVNGVPPLSICNSIFRPTPSSSNVSNFRNWVLTCSKDFDTSKTSHSDHILAFQHEKYSQNPKSRDQHELVTRQFKKVTWVSSWNDTNAK